MRKYQLVDPDPKGCSCSNSQSCGCFSALDLRPSLIPSNIDYLSCQTPDVMMKRSETTCKTSPQKILSFDRIYGPSSRGKASLRYYGNGPY